MKIVKYWAVWCGPCKGYAPVVDFIADELDLEVEAVNVDETPTEGIMSVPTTRLVNAQGTVVAERAGAMSAPVLRAWILEHQGA